MKCKTHPTYKAKRKPISSCLTCLKIWENKFKTKTELCYVIGQPCPIGKEIYTAWHWGVHDPEGLDEELNGDDWP
jgi:hypothetical protein